MPVSLGATQLGDRPGSLLVQCLAEILCERLFSSEQCLAAAPLSAGIDWGRYSER